MGDPPKWMVYIVETPSINMEDLGVNIMVACATSYVVHFLSCWDMTCSFVKG